MKMGRSDLIGRGQKALIPPEDRAERAARTGKGGGSKSAAPPKYRGTNTGTRRKKR